MTLRCIAEVSCRYLRNTYQVLTYRNADRVSVALVVQIYEEPFFALSPLFFTFLGTNKM